MNVEELERDYYPAIQKKLINAGYTITGELNFKDRMIDFVAQRKMFQAEYFGTLNTFFVFSRLSNNDVTSIREFSRLCWKYALKKQGFHLPRGFGYGIRCFPVAILGSISPETAELIQKKSQPPHWSASEMLVVLNLEKNELVYLKATPEWGSFYWEANRREIIALLSP